MLIAATDLVGRHFQDKANSIKYILVILCYLQSMGEKRSGLNRCESRWVSPCTLLMGGKGTVGCGSEHSIESHSIMFVVWQSEGHSQLA